MYIIIILITKEIKIIMLFNIKISFYQIFYNYKYLNNILIKKL